MYSKIKEAIREVYKCQLYCMADMCEKDEPTASMCVDCFYETIQDAIDRIEEAK